MFVSRIELLPEDETTNEHDQAKRAEALQIDTDKGPGGEGLFKGAFTRPNPAFHHPTNIGPVRPIRDQEDGVDRCPVCAWELEEGACMHCGYNDSDDDEDSDESDDTRALSSPSIITVDDSELDGDLDADNDDLEDEYDEDDGFVHPDRRRNITHPPRPDVPAAYRNGLAPQRVQYEAIISDEDDEEEGSDHSYPSFQGADDENSDEESDSVHTAVPEEHSDETGTNDDDEMMAPSDEDSDDESEIVTGARRHHLEHMRPFGRNESPSVAEPESPGSFYAPALAAGEGGYGFSPTRSVSPNSSELAPLTSPTPNTESDEELQAMRPRRLANNNRIPRRPARVVISSDEDSGGSTPTPPRPDTERRNRLRVQRSRRSGRGRGGGSNSPYSTWDPARQLREVARR